MTPDTSFFIVLNASSGKRDAKTVEATIRDVLEQAGRRYDLARIYHQVGMPHTDAVQQGLLVAMTVRPIGTLALLGLLCRGAIGQLGNADNVVSFAFNRLTVRPYRRRRMKVAMDGEVTWLNTPLVFRVASHPLPLLVPARPVSTSPADVDEAEL